MKTFITIMAAAIIISGFIGLLAIESASHPLLIAAACLALIYVGFKAIIKARPELNEEEEA